MEFLSLVAKHLLSHMPAKMSDANATKASLSDGEVEKMLGLKIDPRECEMDSLGQLKELVLTLYGHFRDLPSYVDCKGRFFVKGKMSMHLSPQFAKVKVISTGTHLGFYADQSGAIYMHHRACKAEDIARICKVKEEEHDSNVAEAQQPSLSPRNQSKKSHQAGVHDPYPMMPKMVQYFY